MQNFLIFDTETTGLPLDHKAPRHEVDNWPRIVQLAWLLTDADGVVQSKGNHIIRPVGFEIPDGMVHGITNEQALTHGIPLDHALTDFLADLTDASAAVAHNIDFDSPVIGAECIRMARPDPLENFRAFCTQKQTKEFVGIRRKNGYKWPSLSELHRTCMGGDFPNAHDAMADVYACARCFFHIQRHSPGVFVFPYR